MANGRNGDAEPLTRHRLSDQIFSRLTQMIASGELAPNEALPSVSTLARRFGVSMHVAREAIAALAARGLVSVEHGRGCFVATREQWRLVDPELIALIGSEQALPDLFEVRSGFEVQMASLAALRRTDADLAALAQAVEGSASEQGPEVQVEADYAFHRALARATHNPLFVPLLDAIIGPLRQYWRLSKQFSDTAPRTYQGHLAIYTCVEARDPEGAAQAMIEHLAAGRELCERLIHHAEARANSRSEEVGSSETAF